MVCGAGPHGGYGDRRDGSFQGRRPLPARSASRSSTSDRNGRSANLSRVDLDREPQPRRTHRVSRRRARRIAGRPTHRTAVRRSNPCRRSARSDRRAGRTRSRTAASSRGSPLARSIASRAASISAKNGAHSRSDSISVVDGDRVLRDERSGPRIACESCDAARPHALTDAGGRADEVEDPTRRRG